MCNIVFREDFFPNQYRADCRGYTCTAWKDGAYSFVGFAVNRKDGLQSSNFYGQSIGEIGTQFLDYIQKQEVSA